MKEELKQAIESKYNYHLERYGAEQALQDIELLRHADPEIMKQAGWVREYDLMQDLMNRTFDKMKTKTYPQEVESIINKLNNKP